MLSNKASGNDNEWSSADVENTEIHRRTSASVSLHEVQLDTGVPEEHRTIMPRKTESQLRRQSYPHYRSASECTRAPVLTGTENIPSLTQHELEAKELFDLMTRYQPRNWIFLFLLGLFNNFHYNMVISGANGLAEQYGMKSLVALISFANVFFGIIARAINAFVANRVSYNVRMSIMSVVSLVGLFFVSMSGPFGHSNNTSSFVVLLIGVACTGTAYSYGETVALSFVQRYPPKTVSAWGSGTGISGVITSVLYILLTSAAGLSQQKIFLISMPLCLVYWLIFEFGIMAPHSVVEVSYPDGSRPTRQVILHSGHEERKMRKLQEEEQLGAVIGRAEYKMIMNFFGLSWRTIPTATYKEIGTDFASDSDGELEGHSDSTVEMDGGDGYYGDVDAASENLGQAGSNAARTSRGSGHRRHRAQKEDNLYYPFCRFLCCCCPSTLALRRWWVNNGLTIGTIHNTMFYYYVNLCIVYAAGYAAQLMAPFSFYCKEAWMGNFWLKNSYTISQFCYQLGVFLSRSSLMLFKIPMIGLLSILQIINAVVWIVQSKVLFIASRNNESSAVGLSFILFVWMFVVGLIGGASYVNVFFLILCRGLNMQYTEQEEKVAAFIAQKHGTGDRVKITPQHPPRRRHSAHTHASLMKEDDAAGAVDHLQLPKCSREELEAVYTSNGNHNKSDDAVIVTSLAPEATTAAAAGTRAPGSDEGHVPINPVGPLKGTKLVSEVDGHLACSHSSGSSTSDGSDNDDNGGGAEEAAQLTPEENSIVEAMCHQLDHQWQEKRELAMAMGSLYAMIGICVGTIIDVILTNTMLHGVVNCPSNA